MTTELTAAERATVERFEAAPDDPDSYAATVERVAQILAARLGWHGVVVLGEPARDTARAILAAYAPETHDHPASGHPGTAERDGVSSQEISR